jgi:hypothetical protein
MKNKFYLLLLVVTIIVCGVEYLLATHFTIQVILSGTIFLALVTLLSYWISVRSINDKNPNKFVRGVMGATLIKFLSCIIAAVVFLYQGKLFKPDLFLLMGIYITYTILESVWLSSLTKQAKTQS